MTGEQETLPVKKASYQQRTKKKIDITDKIDAAAIEQLRTPPPNEPYTRTIQWDVGSYEVALLFRKATYCGRISVRISSNAMRTVDKLVDTGTSPN